MKIRNRVAIITGGASGIGAGLAERFAREGAAGIVVADLNMEQARAVAAGIGNRAVAVRCDVGSEADVRALVDTARQQFGRIDIYFSNAGIPPGFGGLALEDQVWERMWRVHCMAHVFGARAVLPEMVSRGEGYFALTSSAAGVLNIVESAPYAATKHAAVGLAEWIRIAYGRRGVRVSCLCPQSVDTAMTRGVGAGSSGGDPMITPLDVADSVVRAMRDETFLVLSHPQTAHYMRRKVENYDRWLGGMQKLHATYGSQR